MKEGESCEIQKKEQRIIITHGEKNGKISYGVRRIRGSSNHRKQGGGNLETGGGGGVAAEEMPGKFKTERGGGGRVEKRLKIYLGKGIRVRIIQTGR